ncbi:MAG: hypothetical protein HY235_20115 [Acidobacteria bacterium]|nr:hypothetical protein [Acidobacteriota bacterium]
MLSMCACAPSPEWYPPPAQVVLPPESEPRVVGAIIAMDSPYVDNYIVGGIVPAAPGSPWRWTHQRPELRFQLAEIKGLRFFMDLVIPDTTFQKTGPVTLRFFVDGRQIGSAHYDTPGQKRFETRTPENVLTTSPMVVAAEIDKVWVSPQDGARLGFLLIRAGFTE